MSQKILEQAPSKGYKKLIVWQKAMELVVAVYAVTEKFPRTEQYGLSSQMRRSAVSIPSNIAEGSKRPTKTDFKHFLSMSLGSGAELETQLEIARRLKFVEHQTAEKIEVLLSEVLRMLPVLIERAVSTRD